MNLIGLLVSVVVAVLVLGTLKWLSDKWITDEFLKKVVTTVIVLIGVAFAIWLIYSLFGSTLPVGHHKLGLK